MYKSANGYVFQTEYARDYYKKNGIKGINTIIYNPVSNKVKNISKRKQDGVIITACRLEPQKNIPLLIKSFSRICDKFPDSTLDIYGEGSEFSSLQKMIFELKLEDRICLRGRTDKVIEKMAEASIFVLSSDYEGMPNALIEAMCVGTACIATDAPTYGCRELITDGVNGYICPVNDADVMSKCIEKLLGDPIVIRAFEKESVKIIEKVSQEKIIKQWSDFIKLVIKI